MENNEPKKLKCYRLMVTDNDEDFTQVDFISLVEDPAIQIDFVAFGKEKNKQHHMKFKIQDSAKRMLSGVFMKANKPIYRVDEETKDEYYVVFEAQDIEKARNKFMTRGYLGNVNENHSEKISDSYVVDSWFIRDKDSNPLKCFGFEVEPGDWVGTIYVKNEEYWNDFVKTGKLKGFSVEGFFQLGPKVEMKSQNFEEHFSLEELELIDKIADMLLDDSE